MAKGTDRKRLRERRAREREQRRALRARRRRVVIVTWSAVVAAFLVGGALALQAALREPTPAPSALPTVTNCTGPTPKPIARDPGPFDGPPETELNPNSIYVVTLKTYCGNLEFTIDPRDAPAAARTFVYLARKKYYDGLRFDLLRPTHFVAAVGAEPGFRRPSKDRPATARGDLLMVDADGDDTVGARFAVVLDPAKSPPGTRIGRKLEVGENTDLTIDRMLKQPTTGGTPVEPVYIIHIEIQEFDRS